MKPAHTRIQFSGIITADGATLEEWSCGIGLPAASYGTEALRQAAADQARAVWASNIGFLFMADTILTRVRLAEVGADGKVLTNPDGSFRQSDSLGQSIPGSPVNANLVKPLQTACVVSLETARNGATGKGRMFLPCPRYALTVERSWGSADVTAIRDNAAEFIRAINGSAAIEGSVQVVSSKGYMSPVTGVKVGRYPDTQRSRRNAVLENYSSEIL